MKEIGVLREVFEKVRVNRLEFLPNEDNLNQKINAASTGLHLIVSFYSRLPI
jgi:hypothetical protein